MPNYVLVIDNDIDTCKEVKYNLDCDHIDVCYCLTAQEGMKKLVEKNYDLVILNTSIPEADGLELLKTIRQLHNVPILLLSTAGNLNEKIEALYSGADAYLAKPLEPEELFAHIHALIRRYTRDLQHKNTRSYILVPYHNLTIHMDKRQVFLAGRPLELTRREFDTLTLFAKHPEQVFTFEQIYEHLWSDSYEGDKNSVKYQIKRLRKKLAGADYIESVHGVGYRFRNEA